MPKTDTEEDKTMSTTQDYQAAEQLLRRPARPGELVIGDKVRPQWIDGGARFWYAVSNGVGRRFVLVDPAAAGAVDGIGPPGDARAHLHVGGRAETARLSSGSIWR